MLHYDGAIWTRFTNTIFTTQNFESITGTASDDVIAVGTGGTIVRYDGDDWSKELSDVGATAVYPPGGAIADIAQDLLRALNEKLGYAQPARRD